ncbi:hypothetical protein ACFYXI_30360 [Microtetraspora malaysiensis]|uniref:Transposase IS701-like DDE domain-containing protein n=1 Tax=Microtetraspora malaysiensis TaxID=161358 RepID=A0ABW6T1L9_9ACTN
MAWDAELTTLTTRSAAPLFARPEPRASFTDLVRGLLADVPRKNSWQLSDHIGHSTANRFEHLLDRAKWDVEALRERENSSFPGCLRAKPTRPDPDIPC